MTPQSLWIPFAVALLVVTFVFIWAWRRKNRRHSVEIARLRKEAADKQFELSSAEVNNERAVEAARNESNDRAQAAVKMAMLKVQQLAYAQATNLEKLEVKHGGHPDVLADLLALDHQNSMIERRAAAIAALCGGFLGRRREAKLYDVLRSAVGRIAEYQRVKLPADSDLGVVGQAVEPVAMVLAELLQNATSCSAPETKVHVVVDRVATGVTVVIEDGGFGMDPETLTHARGLLSAERPINITDLGNPPHFGFPVIALLAQRHGFKVTVDGHSSWGGLRALITLPEALLTRITEQPEMPAPAPVPAEPSPGLAPVPPEPSGPPTPSPAPPEAASVPREMTPGGLPKRTRRTPSPTPAPQEVAYQPQPTALPDESAAQAFGAFQRGRPTGSGNENEEGRYPQ